MQKRIDIKEIEPEAYKAMYAMESYINSTQLDKKQLELIKIRASQINGCAFCLNLHTADALKNGETAQRIFLLDAWRESELFSKEERVVLTITEEITLINKKGLSDKTYDKAKGLFSENYIAQLIMAVITINAWNRIAISTNKPIV